MISTVEMTPFLGDSTGSALVRFELSQQTLAPIPELAEWARMLSGPGGVVAMAHRRRTCSVPA